MPELAEIHRYAARINAWAAGKTFTSLSQAPAKKALPPLPTPPAGGFRVRAESRGKELRLTLTPLVPATPTQELTFSHGLVGAWQWSDAAAVAADGTGKPSGWRFSVNGPEGHVCLVDAMAMSSWRSGGGWGAGRGPDPVKEHAAFVANIAAKLAAPNPPAWLARPLAEAMLDQALFNGIGNYLRAEVLFRAGVSPWRPAGAVLRDAELCRRVLQLCHDVPLAVLDLDLDKYSTDPARVRQFEAWLLCYGKTQSRKDADGRMVWYTDAQASQPYQPIQLSRSPADILGVLPASSSSSAAAATSSSSSSSSSASSLTLSSIAAATTLPPAMAATPAAPLVATADPSRIAANARAAAAAAATAKPGQKSVKTGLELSAGGPAEALDWENPNPLTISVITRDLERFEPMVSPASLLSSSSSPLSLSSSGGAVAPGQSAISGPARLLLIVSSAAKTGGITEAERARLKQRILANDPLVVAALEAFQAEADDDTAELVDSLLRIDRMRQAAEVA